MTTTEFPLICHTCGATGSVSRVTANLQCRCGSTDLDLWDGETKTAASPQGHHTWLTQGRWPEGESEPSDDGEVHLPDHLQASYDTGYNRAKAGQAPLNGFYGEHQQAHDLGYSHGERDRDWAKQSAAHGPGTGWNQSRPDPASNWSDYAGPTPGYNPNITRKNDAGDSHECPVCNGTGQDLRASGGGYNETVCRNCHGTGKVVYPTENDTPSLDAHVPSGPPLGAGSHGHYSSKAKAAPVAVPGVSGTKMVSADQSSKIMAMASTIIANNSGLTSLEAFELARRAVEAFPEDGDE